MRQANGAVEVAMTDSVKDKSTKVCALEKLRCIFLPNGEGGRTRESSKDREHVVEPSIVEADVFDLREPLKERGD
jgi:hypothetical protein